MFVWLNVFERVCACVCLVMCLCVCSCPVSMRLPCSDFCISVFRFVVKSFVCSLPIKRVQLTTSVSFHFISFFAIICQTSDVRVGIDVDVSVSVEAIRHGILIIRIKLFFGFRFATQRRSTLLATMQPVSQQKQQQLPAATTTNNSNNQ